MCTNLSLLHAAGRVTDGGAGRRGEGDGPPPPPGPGRSRKFAPQENDCHLPLSGQGRHCLARAETQDISRNQYVPAPGFACLPPSPSIPGLEGHPICPSWAGCCPPYIPCQHTHSHSLPSLLCGLGRRPAWTMSMGNLVPCLS